MNLPKIAILSGSGELPKIAIANARALGHEVLVLGVIESDFAATNNEEHIPIHIGKINTIIKTLKKNGIEDLLLVGKVKKELLYKGLKLDFKAITLLAKMKTTGDYNLFSTIANDLKKQNITFLSQKKFLQNCLLEAGIYTKTSLTKKEIQNLEYGIRIAENLANSDIGQSVVVYNRNVIAVEAVEGTDQCLKRSGELLRNKNRAALCKSSRTDQDERFDIPTIGLSTFQNAHASGIHTICIKEKETIVVNPLECIKFANKHKMNLVVSGKNNAILTKKIKL